MQLLKNFSELPVSIQSSKEQALPETEEADEMKLVATIIKPGHKSIQWHLILCISMVLLGAIDSGIQCFLPTAELAMEETALFE